MIRRPPRSTRTDTLFPYTTLFRSGVSNVQFLRESLNAQRKARGQEPLSGGDFLKLAREKAGLLKLDMDMLKRPVNGGFSGGEQHRNAMVQLGLLDQRWEEHRVGKAGGSTVRSRRSPDH